MNGRSPFQIVGAIVLGFAVLLALKYFQSQFTGSGVLARAEDVVATDGCAAAMLLLDRAIELGAGFEAYVDRAGCRMEAQEYTAALDDWSDAIKAQPNNPGAHLARGHILRLLERLEEASLEYDRAAELDPGTEIRLLRADFLRTIGKLDVALAAYGELMKREDAPNTASRGTFKYAELQLLQGDAKGAETTVEEGLKRWPDDALGLYERGILKLISEERGGDAADDLARSIEAGSKYRMTSILLSTGIAVLGGDRADKSSYFAFGEPYIPTAIDAILFLVAARSRAGHDGTDELKKNFDDIQFALRPIGSLQSAKLVGWPIPIVKFYLDEVGYDVLVAQAEKSSSVLAVPRVCSANFFASIRPEKGAEPHEIQRRLQFAAEKCPSSSLERALAIAELGRANQ